MSEIPWNFSGRGLRDFDSSSIVSVFIVNSPVFVLNNLPIMPTMSPKSRLLNNQ